MSCAVALADIKEIKIAGRFLKGAADLIHTVVIAAHRHGEGGEGIIIKSFTALPHHIKNGFDIRPVRLMQVAQVFGERDARKNL